MMKQQILTSLLILAGLATQSSALAAPDESTSTILQRFADDYAIDPMATSITFGIEVDGKRWHIVSDTGERAGSARVALLDDFPSDPVFYFKTNAETLKQIDRGVLSGSTAMAAATSADLTPLDVMYMEGYVKPANYDAMLRPLLFHFWTRGLPEIVPLAVEHSRVVHGAPAVVMYYDKDFRSAVYHVPPRLGADKAPTMVVPFPRALVVMSGTMMGTVGGNPFSMPQGHMVLVPPGVPAHLWNDGDEPLQFMFLMFGDGA